MVPRALLKVVAPECSWVSWISPPATTGSRLSWWALEDPELIVAADPLLRTERLGHHGVRHRGGWPIHQTLG